MSWFKRLFPPVTPAPRPPGLKRYRVSFANLGGQQFTYSVGSRLDERKALVIAAGYHAETHREPAARIYRVLEVTQLGGDHLEASDLCDRAEW